MKDWFWLAVSLLALAAIILFVVLTSPVWLWQNFRLSRVSARAGERSAEDDARPEPAEKGR